LARSASVRALQLQQSVVALHRGVPSEIDKKFVKIRARRLDEEEAELEKLRSWHERIRARDVLGCEDAAEAEAALERAAEAVSRYTGAVFGRAPG
jgi:hypothetical protein